MSLPNLIHEIFKEAGRPESEAKGIIQMYKIVFFKLRIYSLEANWYNSLSSIQECSYDQWVAMKLPLRLHKIIQEKLNTTKVLHKPASISKHLENLQISDMNMDKETVQNEINYEKPIEDIKSSLGISEVNLQDSIVKESLPKEINLTQYFQDLDDFEEILHVLNMKGEKHGIQFKKGNIQYYSDKLPKYKSIICNHKPRN